VTYTFGDSSIASERLAIVSRVMVPAMQSVLARCPAGTVRSVIDLGCGPGHTTTALAEHFPAAHVIGVDQSDAYVAEATAACGRACTFVVADVGAVPLPGAPADLVYARYLLSHLDRIAEHVTKWCHALTPGGVLVLEEPESIRSTDPDFARYEQMASGIVRATGAPFYAGPLIEAVPTPDGFDRVHDGTIAIDVTEGEAAAMFWRNARAWAPADIARGGFDPDEVATLSDRLRTREHSTARGLFDWRQRQTVFRRV
jgi:trans-aconitate 2-methyltransferase